MNINCKVRYKNNQNKISEDICELIEELDDHYRIKEPNGQILRIFKDRVYPVSDCVGDVTDNHINHDIKSYDFNVESLGELPEGTEIWVKSNRFNETSVCETIAIIYKNKDYYESINTYNGVAKKRVKYSVKDLSKLIKRMTKKGYFNITKGES